MIKGYLETVSRVAGPSTAFSRDEGRLNRLAERRAVLPVAADGEGEAPHQGGILSEYAVLLSVSTMYMYV